jgi:hypothetical protein
MSSRNNPALMATQYQRESADDSADARRAMEAGDKAKAIRRQGHAEASAEMARLYLNLATKS